MVKNMPVLKITICLLTIFFLAVVCLAQQAGSSSSVIYVESWRAGLKIREQSLKFKLDSAGSGERSEYLRDAGIGYYKIILRRFRPAVSGAAGSLKADDFEYWAIELKQVLSDRSGKNKKEKLGCNLLTRSGCGGGGDYFPREDQVGILFPIETPKNSLEKIFIGSYYPLSAARVVKVQNFYVIIKVNSYQMNAIDLRKMDSMDVTIEFKNEYQPGTIQK